MFEALLSLALSGFLFFVLHVAGSGSFPRPLTAQEEKECLEKMKSGDLKAKSTLIEHNLRLVAHIIKKYYSSSSEQDDLISIGTIGLIKAVNTFDSSKGIRLSSYAARCIENAILPLRIPAVQQKEERRLCRSSFLSSPKDPGHNLLLLFHRAVSPFYVLQNRAAVNRRDSSLQFLLFFFLRRIANEDVQPFPSIDINSRVSIFSSKIFYVTVEFRETPFANSRARLIPKIKKQKPPLIIITQEFGPRKTIKGGRQANARLQIFSPARRKSDLAGPGSGTGQR